MSDSQNTNQALTVKYSPQQLSDVVGQPAALSQLRSFAARPFSTAFVFHGPTGVGKSCAAKALALELGCSEEYAGCGGLQEIPSGKQDGRAVEDLLRQLRLRPMFGSGWKVAIINEADGMTPQAEAIWLDGLEALPPKTVVVFTTNELWRLSRRLIGRCELIECDGESDAFREGLDGLARRVWKGETGKTLRTLPQNLGRYELAAGAFSIRLALQQLAPMVRAQLISREIKVPFIRDDAAIQDERWKAAAQKAVATRRARKAVSHV